MSRHVLLTVAILLMGCATVAGPGEPARSKDRPAPPRRYGYMARLTEQQETELLAVLKDNLPEDYERLMKLKESNPRAYRWALAAAWRRYLSVKSYPPEIQQAIRTQQTARLKSWKLSRRYRDAKDESDKQALRSELLKVMGQEFDAEQKVREYRLAQLAERIKQLRADLKERSERRDEVIGENLKRLLEREDFAPLRRPRRMRGGPTRPAR